MSRLSSVAHWRRLLWQTVLRACCRAPPSAGSSMLAQLSMLRHYEPLLKGLFNSTDVAYYLLIILLFTGFTIRRMDASRLQH